MKKVFFILFVLIAAMGYSQSVKDLKASIKTADKLYKEMKYQEAKENYEYVYYYQKGNEYLKIMSDSCNYYLYTLPKMIKNKQADSINSTNQIAFNKSEQEKKIKSNVERLKKAGFVDFIFGNDGKPTNFINNKGETKDVSIFKFEPQENNIHYKENERETYNMIMTITKKDWEQYR